MTAPVWIGWTSLLAMGLGLGANRSRAQSPEAEARGAAIYRDGTHADGSPLSAVTGEAGTPLPGAFAACANCHGYEARGKTEGGVSPSDIRWENLVKPYEVELLGGRRRVGYDEPRFFTALTRGIDSSGHPLDPAMPRYRLTPAEAADLAAYLRTLERPVNEGVSSDAIRIGLALEDESTADAARSDARLLAAWFAEINRRGGIFRRQIELIDQLAASPGGLVAVLSDNASAPAALACERRRIPVLGAEAGGGAESGRYGFAVYPGSAGRLRAWVRYGTRHHLDGAFRGAEEQSGGLSFGGREYAIQPALLSEASSETLEDYRRCGDGVRVPERDLARKFALLATARVLVTALEGAGRDLGRERLVESLEALGEVHSGFGRTGSFGPNRHVAASGVYVIPRDERARGEPPEWVASD